MQFKGKHIDPYESFYWNTTPEFFRGQLGGGISRTVKTDDSLAVMEASIIDDTFGFEAEPRMYNDVAPTLRSERSGLKVLEPQVMTPKRTEFGKSVRKEYEKGELDISRHAMTVLTPREDGISNTLTSVQKDNLVCEPLFIPEATARGYAEATEGDSVNLEQPSSKTQRGRVGKQIANTLTTSCNQGVVVSEPKAVSYTRDSKGKTQNKHLNEIVNTIHSSTSSGGNTDCFVAEPKVQQIGNIYPDTDGFKNRTSGRVYSAEGLSPTLRTVTGGHNEPKVVEDWQTVLGSKQHNSYIGSTEECSSCITSACGAGGGMTPMLTDAPLETAKTKEFFEQVRGHEPMCYRIRKLTPRECFRLMGCDEETIDTIQAAGISNSQQYKLAGNSIVVDVLYHLFRKMFVETENESQQLTLF